jgi:hypothetical protein
LGVLGVCGLDAVSEVGLEEGDCFSGEVEVVSELVEEFLVRDCVVGFREVDVDGECWVFLDFVFVDLVDMVCSASVVLEFGRNAYWVGEMMLCSVRCSMSWLLMRVSMSLAMIGSREIGR